MKKSLFAASLLGAAVLAAPTARAGGLDVGVYLDLGHAQVAIGHPGYYLPSVYHGYAGYPHWASVGHGYALHHGARHAWRHGYRHGYRRGYRHGYRDGYGEGHHGRHDAGDRGHPGRTVRDRVLAPRLAVNAGHDRRGTHRERRRHRED